MRICIDCRMLGLCHHGIARYALNLVRHLALLDTRNTYFVLVGNHGVSDLLPNQENFIIRLFRSPLYRLGEQLVLPFLLKKLQVDIFHSPTFSAPIFQPCSTIMTIHDLIHLLFPEDYSGVHRIYYRVFVKTAAHRSAKVLTDSKSSKTDLIRYLGIMEDRVSVIPMGVERSFRPIACEDALRKSVEGKWKIAEPYLLWVGNQKPHKNLIRVLQAYRIYVERTSRAAQMVVVGVSYHEALATVSDEPLLERVVFIPRVNDAELCELYSAATLFVYPSLYEGFGFPPLEAMACGCPVITSNVSSLPEVVGDAAILVAPNDIEEIAGAIKRVLTDRELREEMRRKGLERAKLFSWKETARKTLKVYEEVNAQGTI